VNAVSFCDRGGYVCGDCYVTFLCDLFGGHSSTVMDGFADVSSAYDGAILPRIPRRVSVSCVV